MSKLVARIAFEVPDGVTPRQLADVRGYIKADVEKHRFVLPRNDAAWGMIDIDVSSFDVVQGDPIELAVTAAAAGPAPPGSVAPTVSIGNGSVQPRPKVRVLVQKWEESERGWGCRPDGYSIHPSEDALKEYVAAYWKAMPDEVQDEYSRPSGTPYWAEVEEVELPAGKVFEENGLRVFRHEDSGYPGDGGPDGWMPVSSRSGT